MSLQKRINQFLDGDKFAVVGASRQRAKYGNKVLRSYAQKGLTAHPVNPNADTVEGLPAVRTLADLPESVHGVSVVTPPSVTEKIVKEAHAAGIENIWMQPGAESEAAVARAEELGLHVIAGGPCLLVALGCLE